MHRARSPAERVAERVPAVAGRRSASASLRTRRPPYATAISVGTTCLGKGSERSGWRSCRPCGSNARIAWFRFTCFTIANGRGARATAARPD